MCSRSLVDPARNLVCAVNLQEKFDLNTTRAANDPLARWEAQSYSQFCAPTKRADRNDEEEFDKFMITINPMWKHCVRAAQDIINEGDPEVLRNIEAYYNAPDETFLYSPFEFLANYVLDRPDRVFIARRTAAQ